MKNKEPSIIALAVAAVIGGMIINFQKNFMGGPANVKNLIVTFLYVVIWILVLVISIKIKSIIVMKYCSIFWIITLLIAITTTYVNVTGASVNWAIPFVVLFLGQFYGIRFFVESFLTVSIVVAIVSLVMVITSVIALRYMKKE